MARQDVATVRILQRWIETGQLNEELSQWLLKECLYLERTLAAVLEIACGQYPALCAALLEEAQNRARCEMGI